MKEFLLKQEFHLKKKKIWTFSEQMHKYKENVKKKNAHKIRGDSWALESFMIRHPWNLFLNLCAKKSFNPR